MVLLHCRTFACGLLLLMCVIPRPSDAAQILVQTVQPSLTGQGISAEWRVKNHHYVAQARNADQRKNVLVVFLGGYGSSPGSYTEVAGEAAAHGFATLDLRYPNSQMAGSSCALSDACFMNLRGETLFGQGVVYPGGLVAYSSPEVSVSLHNSVLNRLVSLLHFLGTQPPDPSSNPVPAYWAQFLLAAPGSPYEAGGVGWLPDWSKLVVAGHSQGAGHAAFLGTVLPAVIRRVVMFSAPNDHANGNSASWIFGRAATPSSQFWGLRSADEGAFGDFMALNWQNLDVGGNGDAATECNVGTGTADPRGSQRLVLSPASRHSLTNHNSTVANGSYDAIHHSLAEDRKVAWRYLLGGGGAD